MASFFRSKSVFLLGLMQADYYGFEIYLFTVVSQLLMLFYSAALQPVQTVLGLIKDKYRDC